MTIRQARSIEMLCNLVLFACLAVLLAVGCAEHQAARGQFFKQCTAISLDAKTGRQQFDCEDFRGKHSLVEVTPR